MVQFQQIDYFCVIFNDMITYSSSPLSDRPRIDIADVLRGISVLGILALHCIEHFDYYFFPETSSYGLLAFCDKATWDALFFTFAGKAYAVFSLLFGYTFFLQDDRRRREGGDFRLRFVWRLVLLAAFGMVNTAFYPGDVLVLFAIVGMVLPLVARLPDWAVLTIAVAMLLQPDYIAGVVRAMFGAEGSMPGFIPWWQKTMEAIGTGDLWTTLGSNATNGRVYSLIWSFENGRALQSPALMLMGMLIGRRGLFADTVRNVRFWAKAALVGLLLFFPLRGLAEMLPGYIENAGVAGNLGRMMEAWYKLAFMVFMVGALIVVFYRTRLRGALMRITPIGRMSLTMYVMQSVLGTLIFYPWGLDLGTRLGSLASLGVAVVMFAILYIFATLWLRRHKQGPLEWLWRKATWIN